MDLIHDAPPGFDGIAKAFAMAKHLPSTHRMSVRIGFLREGVLFATGELEGYRQVNFLSEHVRDLGWAERLLGGEEDMHGCDMLFVHPSDTIRASATEDPSFIRRTPVELWPALTSHVDP